MKYYFVFSIRLTKKHPSYKKAKREVSGKGFILASVLQKKTVSAYFFRIHLTKNHLSYKRQEGKYRVFLFLASVLQKKL